MILRNNLFEGLIDEKIDKYYIKKQMVNLNHITPSRIGIDEIAYDKGHKYLTIVRDLDLNGIIWIGLES